MGVLPKRRDAGHRGVVLHGKPAAGKGTQGRILDAMPGFVHIPTGRILRSVSEEDRELGQQVARVIERGDLVPDELMIDVLERHLENLIARGGYQPRSNVVVLDGVPRTVGQVRPLADHVDVQLVIHLRCDDDAALLGRVRGRARAEERADDRIEAARKRLAIFERETAPVLDSYPTEIRTEVDALQHPVVVHDAILHALIRRFLAGEGGRHE